MKIYNSLTDKKEEFKTINEGKVNMYVCGPTVYNFIHIGNARPVVFFDIVKRYLTYKGYKVTYASNITDVDDKIINRAIEENVSEKDIVDKDRLAQEVVIYADKCSVEEEITRLNSHIKQLRDLFEENVPIGKKLDFIMQEMNRETNTIGSKSSDVYLVNNVIKAKGEIEKIREQIQNIE